jgi:hypothetical protein
MLERTLPYNTLVDDADIDFVVVDASGSTAVESHIAHRHARSQHFDVPGVAATVPGETQLGA